MASQGSSSAPPRDVYACEVTQDWDPRALNARLPPGVAPPLKVKKGDNVWTFSIIQGYGYIHLPTGDTHLRGWVPLNILKKGAIKVEELPIELPAEVRNFRSTAPQPPQGTQTKSDASVLLKTLRTLWKKIQSEQSLIQGVVSGVNEQSQSIFFHRNATEYGDVVYNCVTKEARKIMDKGNFSIEQLKKLPSVSSTYPKQAGIYIIIYEDFGGRESGNATYKIAIYIGQTVQFQKRKDAHTRDAKTKRSVHYSLARKAKKMVMIPLLLQTESAVPPFFLDIAEFSFVCLFRSWYAALFKPRDPELLGAYTTDHEGCLVFSRLMRQVSSETGWNIARTYGLNWNTPILKHPRLDLPWVAWHEPELDLYKYRTRRTLHKTAGEATVCWYASERIQIPLEVAHDAGLVDGGQSVHIEVEIRKRGDEYLTHPFRYVRFPPQIGRNPELEKLRSLAIKIQWLPAGKTKWKEYYIERSRLWQALSKTNDVLRIYRLGLMILCDIEKISYTGAPAWIHSLSPTEIRFLRYDHLGQRRVVESVLPKVLPWPADNTMAQNTERLVALFPPEAFPDTVIGAKPSPGFFTRGRKSCDMCFSQRTTTACKYDPADNSCQCCRPLNRPCIWSRAGQDVMDLFVHGKSLEELGIAVNLSRDVGSMIGPMEKPPFDPDIEGMEHGDQQG
ncbi:hypothetical protein H9Q72_006037 [Fusarium xylarioides]|uniref:Uncharacterized protein n=1 Tax=Fusarium xylarioides TaxID=221167 RepID=A0A9P7L710_9HYPO|nr:hypothetical protein H9Q72_006037 [Fusarium xylarioides]